MPRLMSDNEQTANISFVQEVEKYPCLYNHTLDDYSRRDFVDAAWGKIAEEFDDTVENSKKKWKNLRTVFVRSRRTRGSGRKLPYYLSKVMQFLTPYIKISINDKDPSNVPSSRLDNEEKQSVGKNKDDDEQLLKTPDNASQTEVTHAEVCKNGKRKKPIKGENDERKEETNQEKRKATSIVDDFMEYFQEKNKNTFHQPESARTTFLLSLVPEVDGMTDIQFRKFRRHILDGIENILSP